MEVDLDHTFSRSLEFIVSLQFVVSTFVLTHLVIVFFDKHFQRTMDRSSTEQLGAACSRLQPQPISSVQGFVFRSTHRDLSQL